MNNSQPHIVRGSANLPHLDVDWQPMATRFTAARRHATLVAGAMCTGIALGFWWWLSWWWLLALAGASLTIAVWFFCTMPRRVARRRYALTTDFFMVRKGWLDQELTMVPRTRVDAVDISTGAFGRKYGYCTISLKTLGGGSVSLTGIPSDVAREVRAVTLGERALEPDADPHETFAE